jgi:triosephosphate isomerase
VGLVRSVGGAWAVVGHSERRAAGERDDDVKAKLQATLGGGLGAILCVGETGRERQDRATFRILRRQLTAALAPTALQPPEPERLAVAYEPVWAIGTGVTATMEQIAEAVAFLRQLLGETYGFPRARKLRILYGGSVTADSAKEICAVPGVDGLLVGGASLDGKSFRRIVEAAAAQASAVASAAAEARR